jgi:peptide/nickel transport system ATP-binding protein
MTAEQTAVKDRTLIEVKNLKTYFPTDEGLVKAVDGVTFDVQEGKTLGIVGESGCGKSVTARSILRIVDRPGRIVEGEILWHGSEEDGSAEQMDLAQLAPNGEQIRQIRGVDISLVFQEPMTSFSPVHTIGNQMIEAILLHQEITRPEAKDLAIDLLRQVGIPQPDQRIGYYAYQLSGGLRQRAMIAMALSNNPRLLIADEPTTALDVTTQAQILELMRSLQEQHGMAIMLITHNLGVVAEMCDDVVVMYLGRVVEDGPVDEIFHNPQHPYTQALLRSIPSIRGEGQRRLQSIEGTIPHPLNRPSGCPFRTRCPSFMPGTCDVREPRLQPISEGHEVSCFLYHDGG